MVTASIVMAMLCLSFNHIIKGGSRENNLRIGLGQYDACYKKDSSFYLGGILFSVDLGEKPDDQIDLLVLSIAHALLGAAAKVGTKHYLIKDKPANSEVIRQIERDTYYTGYTIGDIDVSVSILLQEIEKKLNVIHLQLVSWFFLKSEPLNLKISLPDHEESDHDHRIKVIATTLLNKRS